MQKESLLEAIVSWMFEESGQGSVIWWRRVERDILAKVVFAFFAVRTTTTWNSRFDGHDVAGLQVRHTGPYFVNLGTGLVSQDHGTAHDVVSDPPVTPVVDIRSADPDRQALENHLLLCRSSLVRV